MFFLIWERVRRKQRLRRSLQGRETMSSLDHVSGDASHSSNSFSASSSDLIYLRNGSIQFKVDTFSPFFSRLRLYKLELFRIWVPSFYIENVINNNVTGEEDLKNWDHERESRPEQKNLNPRSKPKTRSVFDPLTCSKIDTCNVYGLPDSDQ